MIDWKEKIDEVDANRIDLVLGNFGTLPKFRYHGKDYLFRWPDQRVKADLVREYLADWSRSLESIPDGSVKRELIKQLGKEVRSVGILQLMEYFASGEQAIVNYMFLCQHGENKLTKEELLDMMIEDVKDEETGQSFMEFAALHVARALVVYVRGKGKIAALEFLRQYKRTSVIEHPSAVGLDGDF